MSIWFLRHPGEPDLALFAGGESGPITRWRIEAHLDGCDRCRLAVGEFFELRSQVMNLAELPHVEWNTLAAGIHRRAQVERPQPWPAWRWRPAYSAVMAVLLLAAAGLYVSTQPAGAVLDASAGGVELRLASGQVLTFANTAQQQTQVSAGAISARYLDGETGNVTVNRVYAE